jgi:hypothetical protein
MIEEEIIEESRFTRFKDAAWFPKEDTPVLIGGAGGISSYLTLLLARAGFKLVVFDFDIVEEHNIGGQLYGTKHIGKLKVDALSSVVEEFTGELIQTFAQKIDSETMTNNICFAGFDNMKARMDMFQSWKREYGNDENAIFIDGRLTMEQITIYCITKDNLDKYENEKDEETGKPAHLFDDSEVQDAPCTYKQTSFGAAMIAAMMVNYFTSFVANRNADAGRYVPFRYSLFLPLMMSE